MAEDRTKGEENLIKRDQMRQECRPIKRTMEEGEPSKNKLSLDPISTENQDTEETTEVLVERMRIRTHQRNKRLLLLTLK